jgi:SAM-dependent methyltransferase
MAKMYDELASWWPLVSAPEDYAEEAALFRSLLDGHGDAPPRTLLELGSGGGNNASHLKRHYEMTLVDLSPGMLAVSRELNPDLPHHEGDMRTVRLGKTFDAVFIHDAIGYMTTEADLAAALATAAEHCREGGVGLFCPDTVRERFAEASSLHEGEGGGRAVRYIEWWHDPEPGDTTVVADYGFLLRERDGSVRMVHDRHVEGLFPRETWLTLLRAAGFEPTIIHDEWGRDLFVGRRRGGRALPGAQHEQVSRP